MAVSRDLLVGPGFPRIPVVPKFRTISKTTFRFDGSWTGIASPGWTSIASPVFVLGVWSRFHGLARIVHFVVGVQRLSMELRRASRTCGLLRGPPRHQVGVRSPFTISCMKQADREVWCGTTDEVMK